jgi:hypothetical protein
LAIKLIGLIFGLVESAGVRPTPELTGEQSMSKITELLIASPVE